MVKHIPSRNCISLKMVNDYFIGLLITLAVTASYTNGSAITFEAYPSVLKTNLTSDAAMMCRLSDTKTSGGLIGRRDVTSTDDDVRHVSSIVITRNNGENVAQVTPFDAPTTMVDLGNLLAKGDVSGTSSEGRLELAWVSPAAMTLGEYRCEINAITNDGHTVVFSTTLEMSKVDPTIMDLVGEFTKQQKTIQQQQDKITHLEQDLKTQSGLVDKLTRCSSKRVMFMALKTGDVSIPANSQPVVFDKVLSNFGGSYDNVTGQFTCALAGMYQFSVHQVSTVKESCLGLFVNSQLIASAYATYNYGSGSILANVLLKTGDIVKVATAPTCGANLHENINLKSNIFTGMLTQSDECL